MVDVLKPDTVEHAVHAIQWAAAEDHLLELYGGGSKRSLGRPSQTEYALDLSTLAGIGLYEPEELVMSAQPGTPLADIEAALAEKGQRLAFEPPDLGPLLGKPPGVGTIGGVFSCNLAGPARVTAGAARDHLLGLHAVNGRGEAFKTGGRVVKNVTGYDLCKLLTGSYGTLAALTDLTFKVLPAPETTRTLSVDGLAFDQAVSLMTAALNSPHDVSAAAYLPGEAATALVRLEGFGPSVQARATALTELLSPYGTVRATDGEEAKAQWRAIRDVEPLIGGRFDLADTAIWRLSVAVTDAPSVIQSIQARGWFADWGGGLLWLATDAQGDAGAAALRAAVEQVGGHATLVRAPEPVRAAQPVFQPQPAPLAALTKRVKESFDPKGILNPGRMYPGV